MKKTGIIIAIVILILAGFYAYGKFNSSEKVSEKTVSANKPKSNANKTDKKEKIKITMYRSPNCGCCGKYAKELEKKGYEVDVVVQKDMFKIKDKYGIPQDKQSCHTMTYKNYFIEGHAPIEAVNKLVSEKPEIDGIGMPGMPAGSLGMGGVKKAPFQVYQAKNKDFSNFMEI